LEGLNKEYNTFNHIIISEFTYEKVKDLVNANYLDEVKVKGKNIAVKIYELVSLK
jgi:class 3 adenylate cyclase